MRIFLPLGALLAGLAILLLGDMELPARSEHKTHWLSAAGLAALAFGGGMAWALRRGRSRRESGHARELAALGSLLEASEASRAEMAQCLHEPVRAMRALLENIQSPGAEGLAVRQLGELIANVDAIGEKIANIRDLARLKSGTCAVSVSSVDLGALLRACEHAFHPAAARAGLDLVVSPVSAWVCSDAVMLQRIMENLLRNAIRFTVTGAVAISCKVSASEVTVTVRDTGVGMYPHQVDGLLSCSQGQAQDYGEPPPAGRGLEVVRRMTALLGHKLSVRSAKGKGSDFSITLKRVDIPATGWPHGAL